LSTIGNFLVLSPAYAFRSLTCWRVRLIVRDVCRGTCHPARATEEPSDTLVQGPAQICWEARTGLSWLGGPAGSTTCWGSSGVASRVAAPRVVGSVTRSNKQTQAAPVTWQHVGPLLQDLAPRLLQVAYLTMLSLFLAADRGPGFSSQRYQIF
jgi:hypothetical protein